MKNLYLLSIILPSILVTKVLTPTSAFGAESSSLTNPTTDKSAKRVAAPEHPLWKVIRQEQAAKNVAQIPPGTNETSAKNVVQIPPGTNETPVGIPVDSPTPTPSTTPPANTQTPSISPSPIATTRLEITPVGEGIQADGRSTIQIEGKIVNEKGEPISVNVIVTLTSSAGKFIGADQDTDQPGFQVLARQGKFTATLQSGLQAQQVRIRAAVEDSKHRTVVQSRSKLPQPAFPLDGSDGNFTGFPQQTDTSSSLPISHTSIPKLEAYTQVEFTTYLRPPLVTGSINFRLGERGTDYWGSYSDFLDPGRSGGTTADLSAAVFATGKVGDWLFTGAYNSKRPLNLDCEGRNRLFGLNSTQFCEQQYPVYGDSSSYTTTAPSIDSVYARFEKTSPVPGAEPDFVMWGDYDTNEFARGSQLYTATTRQLHGFKGNYNFGNLQVTALYSHTANDQGLQRDTITPDGTSGDYYLSKRLLVPGSENVFIELEEINRPGTVRDRQLLARGADYDIDYDRGVVKFHRPILATALDPFGPTLVRRIVVTYENETANGDTNVYAGRVQYNFSQDFNRRAYAAGSYLRQDSSNRNYELYGGDFLYSIGTTGKIIGEIARSNHDLNTGGSVDGTAYRLEAFNNFGSSLQGRAYYRSVEENFSNDATFSFSPGQTRYGASILTRLGDSTSFNVAYDHEVNFGTSTAIRTGFFDLYDPQIQPAPGTRINNSLSTFRAGILQSLGFADVSLEYVNRSRDDRTNGVFTGNASQLVSKLKLPLSQTLTFQAQNELNIDHNDPLYPNRTTLGLDWSAYPGVTVRLAHQFYDKSSVLRGNSITTLDTLLEHKFSDDTSVTGRYSILSGVGGMAGQGALGLNQRIVLAPGLRMNLGYEHIFRNLFDSTAAGNRFIQPYAINQTASSLGLFSGDAYSIGMEYTDNPNFKASGSFEYRDGAQGSNTAITLAAAGKISPALTALVRYQQAGGANLITTSGLSTDIGGIQQLGDTTSLRVGLAYRDPSNDKFNGLLKYEYRQNPSTIPDAYTIDGYRGSTGHIFSAEGIYAPNWRWEFYGKYALYSSATFLRGGGTDGSVHLGQVRAAYKLGYRHDVALEGRWIAQPSADYSEVGLAAETGYYFTPDLRVAVGYSFGSVDKRAPIDSSFRSEGGFYVNVGLKLNELFNGFGMQKPVSKPEAKTVSQAPSKTNDLVSALKQQPQTQESDLLNLLKQPREEVASEMFTGVQK